MTARPSGMRAMARKRQLNALLRQGRAEEADALQASWASQPAPTFTPKVLEPAAYVVRDERGEVTALSEDGLRLVERLASAGTPQMKIASSLSISMKKLKSLMAADRGESDVRLAWESGHGEFEMRMLKLLMKHAKKSFVAAIYLSKSRLGWADQGAAAAAPIQNNVQLILPKSRTRADYFAMLGIVDPDAPPPMKTVEALPPPGPAADDPQSEFEPGATAPATSSEE